MSIEFTCPHCQSLLRVEDANAGKRARCPHCATINRIPGELVDQRPAAPVSHQFFIDSVSGQTYGPITKPELDQWVNEGRISAACVIRATGESTGQLAPVYYPALAEKAPRSEFVPAMKSAEPPPVSALPETTGFNPYASPNPAKPRDYQTPLMNGIRPFRIDLGETFSIAYQLFMQNISLLISVAAVCLIPQVLINLIEYLTQDDRRNIGPQAWLTILVLNLIQTYLVIGQTRISLRIARGLPVTFSELFNGGDKFLAIIGFSLLIIIPVACGMLLLIVPGVFLVLFFWPSYTLIIDDKTDVFGSFGMAFRIGEVNLLNSFVLGVASIGIVLLGFFMFGIGLIFASGYVSVLWAVAYLAMSGQIALRPNQ